MDIIFPHLDMGKRDSVPVWSLALHTVLIRLLLRWIAAASAVMQTLSVCRGEGAKLLIYQSIYDPTPTYGHELRVTTERTKSWMKAAPMSFLRRVSCQSIKHKLRDSVIREGLRVKADLPPQ